MEYVRKIAGFHQATQIQQRRASARSADGVDSARSFMFRLISCVGFLLARLYRLAESEGTIHDKI
jgi:hypothetical protein